MPSLPLVAAAESGDRDISEAASENRLPDDLSPLVVAAASEEEVTELSAPVTLDCRFWPKMKLLFLIFGLSELSFPSPLRVRGTNTFLELFELLMLLLLLVRESTDWE